MGLFWDKQDEHRHKVEQHMHNTSQWISHLHNTDKEHHKRHNELVNYLHQMHNFVCELKKENNLLKNEINMLKMSSVSRQEVQNLLEKQEIVIDTDRIERKLLDKIKQQLPSEPIHTIHEHRTILQEHTQIPKNEPKIEENHEKVLKSETSEHNNYTQTPNFELSYSEKLVLNVLFSAEAPLSYEAIAQRLNKEPGTIKVYVNELKRKGIGLEEFNGPANMKLYALNNKEKVKKLYNIAV